MLFRIELSNIFSQCVFNLSMKFTTEACSNMECCKLGREHWSAWLGQALKRDCWQRPIHLAQPNVSAFCRIFLHRLLVLGMHGKVYERVDRFEDQNKVPRRSTEGIGKQWKCVGPNKGWSLGWFLCRTCIRIQSLTSWQKSASRATTSQWFTIPTT